MSREEECVGDSSSNILGNVKRVAKALLQDALLKVREETNEPKCLDDLIKLAIDS